MDQSHLISVIVPCYNQGSFLDKNLRSIYEQKYKNWECIIVDDGSDDSTPDIAKCWISKDTRFKYHRKSNNGLASARNIGLDKARGNFIQFLDADDFLDNRKFGESFEVIGLEKVNLIVITGYLQFNDFKDKPEKPHFRLAEKFLNRSEILFEWDNEFAIPIHCGIFSSDLFHDFRFPEDLKAKEDWLMWIKFFQKEELKIFFIEENLAFYRRHGGNMTKKKNMTSDTLKVLKYIHKEISDEDYIRLLELRIERHSNTIFSLREQIRILKTNFGFRISRKLKKIFGKYL